MSRDRNDVDDDAVKTENGPANPQADPTPRPHPKETPPMTGTDLDLAPAPATADPPLRTHITVVVDRSGSMQIIRDAAERGIAAFLADQDAEDGEAYVSLCQFDDQYEQVYGPLASYAAAAYGYRLTPRGSTALLDAVGRAIADTETAAGDADLIVFVVVTDGKENASRECTPDGIRRRIAEKTAAGWQFAFLSADLSAVFEARDLGVPEASSAGFDATPQGTREAYERLSEGVRRTRGSGGPLRL